MIVHRDFESTKIIKNAAVTTGSFDGVHIGHYALINRLKSLAEEINGETVIITFYPHPRKVLYPDSFGKDLLMINSQEEKIAQLENSGIDHLVIIPFTKEFAKTSSTEFIEKYLVECIDAKRIILGFNHHFGHNREGDYDALFELSEKYNFKVEEITKQEVQNEVVSSSRIRKALLEGYIQKANAYLDHFYHIKGYIECNNTNTFDNKCISLHKIKIEEEQKLIPPDGIYAASIKQGNLDSKRAMIAVKNCDHSKKDYLNDVEIFFHAIDQIEINCSEKPMICFHKKIVDESIWQEKDCSLALEKAKNEIEELIF